ncbi:Glyoxalase/Bleomycin resistance protein/Dioxygenase superfamily protein [Variovorax sp. HW608]|uniref:VOC family protein n=1 Tax=Variovorax sp. HW608 TaxID=1034889 RepID=UPI0008200859|nr:VOC family protein [Variovorax sp. HW608]SCK14336.1 Glyoxalase/Bleomycin resistance protein/Dioxygenase superfamily protein [Variovorax sp. HW608]
MTTMNKQTPWITDIRQISLAVEDLDATIRRFHEQVGIGPWAVWTPKLTNTKIRGKPQHYSLKLALAWTKDFMWEVVQPLEGPSVFREFLDRNGDGVHHVLVDTQDQSFEQIIAEATARGFPPAMEGSWEGTDFAFLQTEDSLKTTFEVLRRSPDFKGRPEPDYCFPHPFTLPGRPDAKRD